MYICTYIYIHITKRNATSQSYHGVCMRAFVYTLTHAHTHALTYTHAHTDSTANTYIHIQSAA